MTTIKKMFEYNAWANEQLIELCGRLDDDQLEVEAAGVFGRIHPTLVHLVRAEGGYLNRLTGSRPWGEDVDWQNISFDDLLAKARLSGQRLCAVTSEVDPTIRHDVEWDGEKRHFFNWSVILQALYHGIEHRTQVKILLTNLGIDHPELAAWDYTESLYL